MLTRGADTYEDRNGRSWGAYAIAVHTRHSKGPETQRDLLMNVTPDRTSPQKTSVSLRLQRIRIQLGERTSMILLAVVIGLAGGLGAVFFRWLIGTIQNFSWGSAGTPLEKFANSPWYLRLSVPALGGLAVGLICKFLAPEAKGHGVPEVMNAVARLGGVIRPVVAVAKSFASAVCIATGGSVGREGPIVQIGSALGSSLGQVLKLSTRRIRTCVGCGAAAGIAATFNAPIAAAFFAAEVILGEFGVGAFSSVVISSVTATVVGRTIMGDIPAFTIPAYALVNPLELITYVFLGIIAGVIGVLFVQVLYWSEEFFDRLRRIPEFLKPVIGGLGIGAVGLALPEIMGVGYDTMDSTLMGKVGPALLGLLLGAKLVGTCFTLGSGGSGGIFAPSLFMGATLGGIVGHLARSILPFTMASPGAYAVVGMGAMVAASAHAPITAILIIFEMTGDYAVIVGLMVSCILGTLVAQRLRKESIYTIKLLRRGIDLHSGREVNVLRQVKARDILRTDLETVSRTETLLDLYWRMANSAHYEFLVVDDGGELVGIISVDDLRRAIPLMEELKHVAIAEDIMAPADIYLREDDNLDTAMRQFEKQTLEELPVLPSGVSMVPMGTIQRQDVIKAYNKEMLKADLAGSVSARLEAVARFKSWETIAGYVLAQVEAPPHLCRQPLASLHLRSRGIQIVLVERVGINDESRFVFPTKDTELNPGDRAIVFGRRENVEKLLQEVHG